MSIENLKTNPAVNALEGIAKETAEPIKVATQTATPDHATAAPAESDIRRLAEDLVKTHGEKFSNLFGASVFGAQKAKMDEDKKRKTETLSGKIIQRIRVNSQDEMRALVVDCLDSIYKNDEIVNALTEYMCQHYELLNDVELPPTA